MRTTVRLNDALLREVKQLAAKSGRTLTAILEEAIRQLLARQNPRTAFKRITLPTFRGKGLQPGVELDDSASLLRLMESNDDAP